MSISVLQSTGLAAYQNTPLAQAFASNITLGSFLIAFAWVNDPTAALTATDNGVGGGNPWVTYATLINGGTTQFATFICYAGMAGATTLTVAKTGGTGVAEPGNLFCIAEISGANTIDQFAQLNTFVGTVVSTPTITTQQAAAIIIQACQSGGAPTPANGTPFSALGAAAGTTSFGVAGYDIVSTAGLQTPNITASSASVTTGMFVLDLYNLTTLAPQYRQSNASTDISSGTSKTLAFTSNVLANSFLICAIQNGTSSSAFTSVSDNINGAWTQLNLGAELGENFATYFIAKNAAAGALTLTVQQQTSTLLIMVIAEYTGQLQTGNPIEVNTGLTSQTFPLTIASLTSKFTNDAYIWIGWTSPTTLVTSPSGYIMRRNGNTSAGPLIIDSSTVALSPGTFAPTPTAAATKNFIGCGICLKGIFSTKGTGEGNFGSLSLAMDASLRSGLRH